MDYINPKHLIFIICGLTIVSQKTNIVLLLRITGRDCWIAIIGASILAFLYMLFIIGIMRKKNNFDMIDIYKKAVGKFAGTLFLLLLFINLIMQLIECASVEAHAMHTNLFIETPEWYLILFFVIPAIYSVQKGLAPMVSITIIGIFFAMLAGVNLVILTAPYKSYKLLLPLFTETGIKALIFGMLKSLGMYGSLICLFPLLKYVFDKKNIKKFTSFGLFIVAQMLIVSSIGAITTYGTERAKLLVYPKLTQTQEISYFGFIESGELFVMFQIIGGWYVKYVITFFIIREFLRAFKIDKPLAIYLITAIVYTFSIFISKHTVTYHSILNIYYYISLINFVVIPTFIFSIYSFKKKL